MTIIIPLVFFFLVGVMLTSVKDELIRESEENNKKFKNLKWNEQTWVVILFLIFFFPLGLYFTWKTPIWSIKKKTIISLFYFFPLGIYKIIKHKLWFF
jgi:protein-S-isoprenylcysteine O-methyltransferase Ste14